jgi:hypothetical protein
MQILNAWQHATMLKNIWFNCLFFNSFGKNHNMLVYKTMKLVFRISEDGSEMLVYIGTENVCFKI